MIENLILDMIANNSYRRTLKIKDSAKIARFLADAEPFILSKKLRLKTTFAGLDVFLGPESLKLIKP